MKAINKINDSLKYNTNVNNRNVVAAICVLEFKALQKLVDNDEDYNELNNLIRLAKKELISPAPMKLYIIKDIMPTYKIYNNSCCGHGCNSTCNPSDGSITIAKLAQETIDLILNKAMAEQVPSVVPEFTVAWKNNRTGDISSRLQIEAEVGDTFEWSGSYTWKSEEGYSNPYKIESNIFDKFVADGEVSETKKVNVNTNVEFTLTFYAINGTKTSVISSVKFYNPIYYGIVGKPLIKKLSEYNRNSVNVTTEENEYFVYKYPISLPKLSSIIMDDSFNVILAFNYSEENFTTDTGLNTTLRVYTSANPGAFDNVKLSFR